MSTESAILSTLDFPDTISEFVRRKSRKFIKQFFTHCRIVELWSDNNNNYNIMYIFNDLVLCCLYHYLFETLGQQSDLTLRP